MRPALLLLPLLLACSGASAPDLSAPPSSSSSSSSSGGSSGTPPSGPTTPPQSLFDGESIGCGDVSVYRASSDRTQYVTVVLDREALGLAIGSKATYDLARAPSALHVGIDVWTEPPNDEYCSDFKVADGNARTAWEAEAGKITIELSNDPTASPGSGAYRATIEIEAAHFIGPSRGVAAYVPRIVIENVRVGWLPG